MKNVFSVMPNLQTNFHFKLDFQNGDQHNGNKWLIHRDKYRKNNPLQSLEPSYNIL